MKAIIPAYRYVTVSHPRHTIMQRRAGFTLIEIMIVIAITGIVLAIAGPTWIRQRTLSQQRVCQENLQKIDGAKEQWALETKADSASVPVWDDLIIAGGDGYLKKQPECPASGNYSLNSVNAAATCTINAPLDHNNP